MLKKKKKVSDEVITFFKLVLTFFIVSVIFRVFFYFTFKESAESYSSSELIKAFYIGLRFDIRASILLSLAYWPLGYIFKFVNYFFEDKERTMFFAKKTHPTKILSFIFSCVSISYIILLIGDLGHYEYLKNRVDASVFIFLKNAKISLGVISQSYPIFLILVLILFLFFFQIFVFSKFVFSRPIFVKGEKIFQTQFRYIVLLFFLTAAVAHAKLSQYPLRWSEAFFSQNSFIIAMSLNPLLYLNDSLEFSESQTQVNEEKVKAFYPIVSEYLKVTEPNIETLNFERTIEPTPGAFEKPPHLVVIMMESLAAFKMSHFGQQMNGTPFLDSLVPQSLFFENAYVTSTGTARSIFGTLTGLPDVNSEGTASRNPSLVKQYSAINALTDYEKSFVIGGDANWGNIRGFVKQSLENVTLYEEKDFQASKNDVWGISDLKLFEEAHKILKEKTPNKNQFMFIQTAGYHRPYTIPKEHGDFEVKALTAQEIKKNGFSNNEEYNSLRFSDYALSKFFELAKQEEYFKNTLFVIYADHGLSHFDSDSIPDGIKHFRLPIMHIPLFFYSPALKLPPTVYSKIAYHPDFLPSAISLMGYKYVNKTLGRNLFDSKYDDKRFALTLSSYAPLQLRIHDNQWLSTGDLKKVDHLYPYTDRDSYNVDVAKEHPDELIYRDKLARGLFETIRYLYFNSTIEEKK